MGRAFDKTVRRKPLAGAADAGLWEFNRFLPEKPCQTGILAKRFLLMLIDVELLATIRIILPRRHPLFKGQFRGLCLYTR